MRNSQSLYTLLPYRAGQAEQAAVVVVVVAAAADGGAGLILRPVPFFAWAPSMAFAEDAEEQIALQEKTPYVEAVAVDVFAAKTHAQDPQTVVLGFE